MEVAASASKSTSLHAAERWASIVVAVVDSQRDPKTLTGWSRDAGVSLSTLCERCHMAGVKPKPSLDFARVLRAVVQARLTGWHPENLLDVGERRTLIRLLRQAALSNCVAAPTVQSFLVCQGFVTNSDCLREVRSLLARRFDCRNPMTR